MNSQGAQRAIHQQSSNSLIDGATPQHRFFNQTACRVPDTEVFREKQEENARTTLHFNNLMQHLKKIQSLKKKTHRVNINNTTQQPSSNDEKQA
jgi:hypothetical protein